MKKLFLLLLLTVTGPWCVTAGTVFKYPQETIVQTTDMMNVSTYDPLLNGVGGYAFRTLAVGDLANQLGVLYGLSVTNTNTIILSDANFPAPYNVGPNVYPFNFSGSYTYFGKLTNVDNSLCNAWSVTNTWTNGSGPYQVTSYILQQPIIWSPGFGAQITYPGFVLVTNESFYIWNDVQAYTTGAVSSVIGTANPWTMNFISGLNTGGGMGNVTPWNASIRTSYGFSGFAAPSGSNPNAITNNNVAAVYLNGGLHVAGNIYANIANSALVGTISNVAGTELNFNLSNPSFTGTATVNPSAVLNIGSGGTLQLSAGSSVSGQIPLSAIPAAATNNGAAMTNFLNIEIPANEGKFAITIQPSAEYWDPDFRVASNGGFFIAGLFPPGWYNYAALVVDSNGGWLNTTNVTFVLVTNGVNAVSLTCNGPQNGTGLGVTNWYFTPFYIGQTNSVSIEVYSSASANIAASGAIRFFYHP